MSDMCTKRFKRLQRTHKGFELLRATTVVIKPSLVITGHGKYSFTTSKHFGDNGVA